MSALAEGGVDRDEAGASPRSPRRTADDGHLALSVWVRLLKAHGLVLRELRRRVPEGLTIPQFDVLVQLQRREEGMTPGELTRALLVTAGNVTGLVERLVRLGFVERRPVPEDRRAVRVRLSPRGQEVMRRAIPRHRRDVRAVLGSVAPRDLARLRDLLGRLNRTLERDRA
jgi:DNA-binding MarR family transcriptional regulator